MAMTKRTGIIWSGGCFGGNQTGHNGVNGNDDNGGELHVDAGLVEETNMWTRMEIEDSSAL
jgi:hypothetical protein